MDNNHLSYRKYQRYLEHSDLKLMAANYHDEDRIKIKMRKEKNETETQEHCVMTVMEFELEAREMDKKNSGKLCLLKRT